MAKKRSTPKISTANAPISEKPAASARSNPATTVTIHDQQLHRGEGGELHQFAEDGHPVLTTAQGGPIADDQNTLRVGARGPALIDDFHFREKIFHFDHERIPERVVHARGYGAHGFFETYESLAAYTRADLFQRPGEKDACVCSVLDGRRQQRLSRSCARRAGFCGQDVHSGGQLGFGRQQHPGVFHSGRHQVPGRSSRCQAGTRPGVSTGSDGS